MTLDDYLNLITSEHRSQPNFVAAVTALLEGLVGGENTIASYPEKYDLDSAVGQQLDVVGQWVGLSRNVLVSTPGLYFSLDIAGVGLDEGIWYSSLDSGHIIVTLTDEIYRLMLRVKIAINHWDGTMEQAGRLLDAIGVALAGNTIVDKEMLGFLSPDDQGNEVFLDLMGNVVTVTDQSAQITNTDPVLLGYRIFLQDNFDMSITIGIAGTFPSALLISLLKSDALFLRPAAVKIRDIISTSVDRSPIFGLDTNNSYIGGLDVGSWGLVN